DPNYGPADGYPAGHAADHSFPVRQSELPARDAAHADHGAAADGDAVRGPDVQVARVRRRLWRAMACGGFGGPGRLARLSPPLVKIW
ncbi:MAG TPA: hypothetical protein VGE07_03750, partial [Herpetosiphonaceae bacterium]